ncbi:MAG TPA: hypothetical protein VJN39_14175 [Gemmatimonadales bacterium]|nr:hypothetical protein [Gemmatimonadales bacterium]
MPGPEKERDWDKEMAEVDRLLKRLPGADPTLGRGAEPTVRRPAVPGGAGAPGGLGRDSGAHPLGGGRVGTWVRVVLGVLVGVGVAPGVWPYAHDCGTQLILYLLGVLTVIVAGVWSSVSSWRRRLGFAHLIAQVLIVWGVLLLTGELVPRMEARPHAAWVCTAFPQRR